jgi:hypothetical protein
VVETGSFKTGEKASSADKAGLPREFFKDFSGVKIGKKIIEITPEVEMLSGEDVVSTQKSPPTDPSETVGVLKWGTRQERRLPKKSQS